MSYTAEISRNNPACFLFLIDQSGSMQEIMPDGYSKAYAVADMVNTFLQGLIIKCAKSDGVRDYFYVGVIGYGQDSTVVSAFDGNLLGQELIPISVLAANPLEVQEKEQMVFDEQGNGVTQKYKRPIWFYPIADGMTPMKEAFSVANQIISNWIAQNPHGYPPTVIHITDGASSDGDPSQEMTQLRGQASTDGNVLLFNLHLSIYSENPIVFPSHNEGLPDQYAQMLFNNSSELIPSMIEMAKEEYPDLNIVPHAKGFVFNGDIHTIIKAFDIGTRPGKLA